MFVLIVLLLYGGHLLTPNPTSSQCLISPFFYAMRTDASPLSAPHPNRHLAQLYAYTFNSFNLFFSSHKVLILLFFFPG